MIERFICNREDENFFKNATRFYHFSFDFVSTSKASETAGRNLIELS